MDKLAELQKTISKLDSKVSNLESRYLIEDLILRSEYKILSFAGESDGASLFPMFDISLVIGKRMILKSIQFIPYYTADSEDVRYSDGTTETILSSQRVNRLFDWMEDITGVTTYHTYVAINQRPIISINGPSQRGGLPMDFRADNIYYLVPNKVKDITIQLQGELTTNIATGAKTEADLKCFLEVYLFND